MKLKMLKNMTYVLKENWKTSGNFLVQGVIFCFSWFEGKLENELLSFSDVAAKVLYGFMQRQWEKGKGGKRHHNELENLLRGRAKVASIAPEQVTLFRMFLAGVHVTYLFTFWYK